VEHTHCPEDRNAVHLASMSPPATPSPSNVTLLTRLGVGTVFEVEIVVHHTGALLVRKRLAPFCRAVPEAATALEREARILETMGGRHLPALVGRGTDDQGPFLLQTPAKGRPLRDLAREAGAPFDAARFSRLAVAATSALADLHDREDDRGRLDFVHGDISPDNVFWDEKGTATFVDLSNATFREAPLSPFPQARGSLPYVAPEIARNEQATDAASDTYAMAATLLALGAGPIVQNTTEAAMLFEVATRGISPSRIDRLGDLPPEAREALALALRFERPGRLTSSRELFLRFVAVFGQ
jgi:eukaryotic-like serine/threonine-protein kinase